MAITFSNRIAAAAAGTAVAAGLQALAWPAGAGTVGRRAGDVVVQQPADSAAQAAAVRYWTPARIAGARRAANGQPTAENPMRYARRLIRKAPSWPPTAQQPWLAGDTSGHGLDWTHGGAVAAAVGKVFFTLHGEDYVCSGTLVGGKHADVVLTAAHCVTDGSARAETGPAGTGPGSKSQWATNWIFAPGFRDGLMPYGEYTARRFFVAPGWTGPASGSEQYDVAFVQVTAALYGTAGAAKPPSGLPVEFAGGQDAGRQDLGSLSRTYVFGYPAQPPYGGLTLSYCAGSAVASSGSARTPCEMTAGDSGGPWFTRFSPRTGSGPVVAVSTYKVADDLRVLYGAVLGPQAHALYQRAISPTG
jgi:V8-like Glu-specific endopeptidase